MMTVSVCLLAALMTESGVHLPFWDSIDRAKGAFANLNGLRGRSAQLALDSLPERKPTWRNWQTR
jgi:hypothetical protein